MSGILVGSWDRAVNQTALIPALAGSQSRMYSHSSLVGYGMNLMSLSRRRRRSRRRREGEEEEKEGREGGENKQCGTERSRIENIRAHPT